jgi:hypothetical protein
MIDRLFSIIRGAGKAPGSWAGSPEAARSYIERGAPYVTVTERNVIVPAFQTYTRGIRQSPRT